MRPLVSVIFPVYDERENLAALTARAQPVLERATDGSFEVLFVDDALTNVDEARKGGKRHASAPEHLLDTLDLAHLYSALNSTNTFSNPDASRLAVVNA